jgi:pimeloyl-ACP methyl ester carboxylesterase
MIGVTMRTWARAGGLVSIAVMVTATATATAGPAAVASTRSPASASAGSATSLTVGAAVLHPCAVGGGSWCGTQQVPLDYTDPSAGTITVGYAWFPSSGRSEGTIVAMEGGPGYPSTGTAPDFLALFQPLLRQRDLLVLDARGTGRSTPVNCASLQSYTGNTATEAYRRIAAQCGEQLNRTFRRTDGSFVHASDLFGTANVARDLAGVIGTLRLGKVDLYGDSYGTYFSQTFASRYPQLLRSVTLDAAYEVVDLDPWYTTTVTTARAAFDSVCRQSLACSRAAPGSSWARISALAERLRRAPIHGWTVGVEGQRVFQTVDIRGLVDMVNDAGYDYGVYRDLDAAARALLDRNDPAPLLRQLAQDIGYDDSDYVGPARSYSDGLYVAVACTDYPQLFDMRADPATRRTQLAAAEKALPRNTFAPFTAAEWVQMNTYTEDYTGCLDWPAPTHNDPPILTSPPLVKADVPILVLNGSIDSLTPAQGGAHVAAQLGPEARFVEVPNMVHLVGLDDPYGCGASLVQAFVAHPERLATLDTSCTRTVPEVRAVGTFPGRLSQVSPARPLDGSNTERTTLQLAGAGVATVGDAVERWFYQFGSTDLGLRGGSVRAWSDASGATHLTLRGDEFVPRVAVDGRATIDADGLGVSATVTVTPDGGRPLRVLITWDGSQRHALATISGSGLHAVVPAP